MKRFRSTLGIVIAFGILYSITGCGSSMMMQTKRLEFTENNKAMVTFIRPSLFGGAIKFGIWDSDNFIGVLTAKSYIQYLTEPGEHWFLGRAENWSCVKANLEAGKNYYILGNVFPGVWKARVAFDPINAGDKSQDQIDQWLKQLKPIGIIEEKRDSYVSRRLKQIKDGKQMFESGKGTCLTLLPGDGR